MKCIFVKVRGSGSEPAAIEITPGVTAGEILSRLSLKGYVLTMSTRPNANKFDFDDEEIVFDELRGGERLTAVVNANVSDACILSYFKKMETP